MLQLALRYLRQILEALLRLPRFLQVGPEDRKQMYIEIDGAATLRSIPYWSFIFAACGIATLGLILNSAAVIIGAMLVSPLMAPILGLGLSVAVGDAYLAVKSLLTILASLLVATLTAALITFLTPINEVTPEILARTNPSMLDLFVALFCGLVAAYSSVRSGGHEALGSVAPGAAIGVALMPPVCVVGYGLGHGFHGSMMWGAFLLFLTNLLAIMIVSSLFYVLIYRGAPREKYLQMLAEGRSRHLLYQHPWLRRLWNDASPLNRRRFVLPLLLLAALSYPLTSSLILLKQSNDLRQAVRRELASVPDLQVLRGSEALQIDRDQVSGQIVYAGAVDAATLEEKVNSSLQARFGEVKVRLRFQRVAGETDLDSLRSLSAWREATAAQLYDPANEEHASIAARALLDHLGARFPPEYGAALDLELSARSGGGRWLKLYYVGADPGAAGRKAMAASLLGSLRAGGSEIDGMDAQRVGGWQGSAACGRNTESELVAAQRRAQSLEAAVRRNPELRLHLLLRPELALKMPANPPAGSRREPVAADSACALRYELSTAAAAGDSPGR